MSTPTSASRSETVDAVLVGAGVMSATLAAFLKELEPDWTIEIVERLDAVAAESSDAWNNAGTGHAALCELNYTPEKADGAIDISKAVQINESFEISKQFWAHLVAAGKLENPRDFIRPIPHLSFVRGADDVSYLRKRHKALEHHPLFAGMRYTEDHAELASWIPLMMEGRRADEILAATRADFGTDVNFGALTRNLVAHLGRLPGVVVRTREEVTGLRKAADGRWDVAIRSLDDGTKRALRARFVFLGAGGGALPLLQKSGIPEGRGFGGFPVSGQWLRCVNPDLIARHSAKVYGKASVGAPPMSVPHLDTRVIDGKKALLFGPYAGFSTKFLKRGSFLDLPLSLKPDNLWPMVKTGIDNVPLTKYLIGQVLQSPAQRLAALRDFLPGVKAEDWKLEIAGQRVQVIKKDAKKGGVLQFGTEVICAGDGTISALLGASPGASTSVPIMLGLLGRCFPEKFQGAWKEKLHAMIPSHGLSLASDAALVQRVRSRSAEVLQLREGAALPH